MSARYLLAIDAGSSGCRSLIFHPDGRVVSASYQKWSYQNPSEAGALAKEFAAEAFWQTICQLVRSSIKKSGAEPEEIIAVCATSQRQGVVFLDANGKELYAGPNTDLRALLEGFSIDGEIGDRISRITGHSPSFMFTPAKMRWFKMNRPGIYERIESVLTISNWITFRLSGRLTGELSSDADAGMVDVCGLCWSQELADSLNLPLRICPDILPASTLSPALNSDRRARRACGSR